MVFVIKISIAVNFPRLRSKLTSEKGQKVESLDKKMTQNWLKESNSLFLSRKPILFKEKWEKLFNFVLQKEKCIQIAWI